MYNIVQDTVPNLIAVPLFVNLCHDLAEIHVLPGDVAIIGSLNNRDGHNQIPAIHALQLLPVLVYRVLGLLGRCRD